MKRVRIENVERENGKMKEGGIVRFFAAALGSRWVR